MKKRILFVDDEQLILDGLRDRLRRKRRLWDMVFVTGGQEALEILEQRAFDVIVTDMRMPGMDGVDLLSHVRRRHPETVRFILSGYAEQERLLQSVPVAHQFLSKPCDAEVLEASLTRVCGLRDMIGAPHVRAVVGGLDRLPPAPRTHEKLSDALARDDVPQGDIVDIVSRDGAVAVKILQTVNSGFVYNTAPILSLEDAVAHLGLAKFGEIARMAEMLVAVADDPMYLADLRSYAVEVAERAVACFGDDFPPAEVYTAALLHDVGRIILTTALPDASREIRRRAAQEQRPLHEVEYEELGTSHAETGAYLLGLWGLPEPLVEAAAHHHRPSRAGADGPTLLTAVHVTDRIMRGRDDELDRDYIEQIGCGGSLDRWLARLGAGEPTTS